MEGGPSAESPLPSWQRALLAPAGPLGLMEGSGSCPLALSFQIAHKRSPHAGNGSGAISERRSDVALRGHLPFLDTRRLAEQVDGRHCGRRRGRACRGLPPPAAAGAGKPGGGGTGSGAAVHPVWLHLYAFTCRPLSCPPCFLTQGKDVEQAVLGCLKDALFDLHEGVVWGLLAPAFEEQQRQVGGAGRCSRTSRKTARPHC